MFNLLKKRLKKIFLAGLFVTLPIAITIYFSLFLFNAIDKILGPSLTKILILLGISLNPEYRIPGLGLVITLLIVFLSGLLVTNFIGKKIVTLGEKIVNQIPVINSIYSLVKQVIETFANVNSSAFKTVVKVEFPKKGMHTIGFISSKTEGELKEITEEETINVFIPTVPNITTGFFLMIPIRDLTPLRMSVEDGMKMVISGGIIMPKYNPDEEPQKING